MRRSLPGTVSTSQSRSMVPTCGWWMRLADAVCGPISPAAQNAANRSLPVRNSVMSSRNRTSAG